MNQSDIDLANRINTFVAENKGTTRKQIHKALNTTHYACKKLLAAGMLKSYPKPLNKNIAAQMSRKKSTVFNGWTI